MLLERNTYDSFGGTDIEDELYERLEYRARMFLNHATYGRVLHMKEVPECVQRAMFELIELYNAQTAATGNMIGVTSASNDGISISYGNEMTNSAVKNQAYALVKDYLSDQADDNGVPLLYKGVHYIDSVWK